MTRRLYCPAGACVAFVIVVALVVGGLGWVTVASLRVEAGRQEAAVRAERAGRERLALWRLDGQILPALGVENNRPFAQYAALHPGFPAVDTSTDTLAPWSVRLPSPLLSADIPDWMSLHFTVDPEAGWASPQVVTPRLATTLCAPPINLHLANVTEPRRVRLADLRRRFPADAVARTLAGHERQTPDADPFVVPYPATDEPASAKPGSTLVACPDTTEPDMICDGIAPAMPMTRPTGPPPQSIPAIAEAVNGSSESPGPATYRRPSADWAERYWSEFFAQNQSAPNQVPTTPNMPPQVALPQTTVDSQGRVGLASPSANEFAYRQQLARQVSESRGGYELYGNAMKPMNRNDLAAMPVPPGQAASGGGGSLGMGPGQPAVISGPPVPGPTDTPLNLGPDVADREKLTRFTDLAPLATSKGRGSGLTVSSRVETLAQKETEAKKSEDRKLKDRLWDSESYFCREKSALLALSGLADETRISKPGSFGRVRSVSFGVVPCERKPPPTVRPMAVQVGPLRAVWLTATDGSRELVLVRAARLADRTVYQGVLLDWPLLQSVLGAQITDLLPTASLVPADRPTTAPLERGMTALPVVLEPGPLPPAPGVGWTTLRVGLALAWTAALVALLAVGVGGYSLVGLSERRIRFVSAVTHELRTPLTSLRLYLDLLTSGMVDDEAKKREYLTTLAAESDRLNRLIENVLDFARLEKRTLSATLEPTPVAELLAQVRATWADRYIADGKELVVVQDVPEASRVNTDARMAAQVLGNLIDNARKYSRDAADTRVWLRARPGPGGRVLIEVEDRGPGVPARERGSIFRAFRRGRSADEMSGGAGLGLALSRQWAEAIGGRLTYGPADGGTGACFRLDLPGG